MPDAALCAACRDGTHCAPAVCAASSGSALCGAALPPLTPDDADYSHVTCLRCQGILVRISGWNLIGLLGAWQALDRAAGARWATTCVCGHGREEHWDDEMGRKTCEYQCQCRVFQPCACGPCWGKETA